MARIRWRGNKATEAVLAKLLRKHGVTGWRRQQALRFRSQRSEVRGQRPTIVIRTDFIFPKQRVAVFVDGCFWHGCPRHCSPMKWIGKSSMKEMARSFDKLRMTDMGRRTGKKFWREKLAGNRARDRFVTRQLRRQGWRVIRIWEHELGGGRGLKTENRRRKSSRREGEQESRQRMRDEDGRLKAEARGLKSSRREAGTQTEDGGPKTEGRRGKTRDESGGTRAVERIRTALILKYASATTKILSRKRAQKT